MTQPHALLTLVTPSFNQAKFIEETIQSVLAQDYQPIEYLVLDAGSTDGTVEILRKYEDRLTWISEPDKGQADAINKGFRRAHGSILAWLNADDLLMPGALKTVMGFFERHPQASFVYGDALAIDERGRSFGRRTHVRACTFESLLTQGDFIVQPTAFWRADLWQAVGELDDQWQYVLDYEYWIRAAQHYDLFYLPQTLAKERLYGAAKTFRGGIARITELDEMPRRYGGAGVPAGFRAEAAALYLLRAWDDLKGRKVADARADVRTARQFNNASLKMLLYLTILIIRGEGGIAGLRLFMNRFRSERTSRRRCSADVV